MTVKTLPLPWFLWAGARIVYMGEQPYEHEGRVVRPGQEGTLDYEHLLTHLEIVATFGGYKGVTIPCDMVRIVKYE
ncbi:MAG: hypothetical protein J4428_05465 [Candidatus Aenigmarchaeota archaeon]|nr:hypothetical protein [Candidatus Aenigmarchaeota archaeon]